MTTAHRASWSAFQPGQERCDVRPVLREPAWKRVVAVILAVVAAAWLVVGMWA